jgi:hypothetical protein
MSAEIAIDAHQIAQALLGGFRRLLIQDLVTDNAT